MTACILINLFNLSLGNVYALNSFIIYSGVFYAILDLLTIVAILS